MSYLHNIDHTFENEVAYSTRCSEQGAKQIARDLLILLDGNSERYDLKLTNRHQMAQSLGYHDDELVVHWQDYAAKGGRQYLRSRVEKADVARLALKFAHLTASPQKDIVKRLEEYASPRAKQTTLL